MPLSGDFYVLPKDQAKIKQSVDLLLSASSIFPSLVPVWFGYLNNPYTAVFSFILWPVSVFVTTEGPSISLTSLVSLSESQLGSSTIRVASPATGP